MKYDDRKGPEDYRHHNFEPVFMDEQSPVKRANATALCGDSIACQFDYIATESREFAVESKLFDEGTKIATQILSKS
jgi:hypothetical protein